ncbi:hypothetical protein VCHA47P369_70142 [Vibrio chagasii]|nr:hypothetical protein VCHA29O39_110180 [Vibrio chagasii]CAH6869494.1 hypothetical protein VCHA37O173_20063 [Vibrio chagasii]CAH6878831.1 hypothetical protein VCHA32O87_280002 [Vibrio chagasii]CAH6879465.1 hypothetical protein VCHA34P117_20088 [Vibrio chagasii]CAH6920763.1 hypothetical protein VCHA37P199_100016 [Vibrio chagasii]
MRNERDRESRLWCEIPDTSFLGSGMTLTNRVNVWLITSKTKNYKRVTLYIHNPPVPSFPTVRNERDRESRL